jgi:hypothetical protein
MGSERPISALADQVDKRLPDDNEHAHHHPDTAPQRRYNLSSASWRGWPRSWPRVSYPRRLPRPRVSESPISHTYPLDGAGDTAS